MKLALVGATGNIGREIARQAGLSEATVAQGFPEDRMLYEHPCERPHFIVSSNVFSLYRHGPVVIGQ